MKTCGDPKPVDGDPLHTDYVQCVTYGTCGWSLACGQGTCSVPSITEPPQVRVYLSFGANGNKNLDFRHCSNCNKAYKWTTNLRHQSCNMLPIMEPYQTYV